MNLVYLGIKELFVSLDLFHKYSQFKLYSMVFFERQFDIMSVMTSSMSSYMTIFVSQNSVEFKD